MSGRGQGLPSRMGQRHGRCAADNCRLGAAAQVGSVGPAQTSAKNGWDQGNQLRSQLVRARGHTVRQVLMSISAISCEAGSGSISSEEAFESVELDAILAEDLL
jgi:hypothetical protein